MADEEVIETLEEIPAEVPAVEVPEPPKPVFRKVIQPLDEEGQPIGQPHVYESDTEEGLMAKMAEGIANGTRKIHQLTRKSVLETPKAPEGAEVQVDAPVWRPRPLTEDEKFLIKTDPEQAFDIQYKARFGRTPEEQRAFEQEMADNAKITREKAETDMFTEDTPEFYRCNENRDAIIQYMQKHKLAWRKKNLDSAYKELSESGLLKAKPVEAAPVVEVPAPEARTEPPAAKKPDFPAVIRNNSSRATAPIKAKDGKPTAEEIAMMTADEMKQHYPELHQAR